MMHGLSNVDGIVSGKVGYIKKQKVFITPFLLGDSIFLSIATYSLKQKSLIRKRRLRVY